MLTTKLNCHELLEGWISEILKGDSWPNSKGIYKYPYK